MEYTGIVKWFSKEKGYGFIMWDVSTLEANPPSWLEDTVKGKTKVKIFEGIAQIMVHISNTVKLKPLNEGDMVSFTFKNGKFGAMADKVALNN